MITERVLRVFELSNFFFLFIVNIMNYWITVQDCLKDRNMQLIKSLLLTSVFLLLQHSPADLTFCPKRFVHFFLIISMFNEIFWNLIFSRNRILIEFQHLVMFISELKSAINMVESFNSRCSINKRVTRWFWFWQWDHNSPYFTSPNNWESHTNQLIYLFDGRLCNKWIITHLPCVI